MFSLSFTSNYMMIFPLWFLLWLISCLYVPWFSNIEDFLVIFLFLPSSFLPVWSETIPCDLNMCYLWDLPYWLVYGKFHMCYYHLHFIKLNILQLLDTTFCICRLLIVFKCTISLLIFFLIYMFCQILRGIMLITPPIIVGLCFFCLFLCTCMCISLCN